MRLSLRDLLAAVSHGRGNRVVLTGTTTVTWREPTRKGDNSAVSDIASYNIKYSTVSGTHSTVVNVAAPATSKLLTGLAVGVPIYVVITSVRSGGAESPESAEATYTPA